ncbi:MAG: hypothetical protein M3N98_15395 [Actinomycetota bacterium]|nr:hypothetical protein [Actinomycetota bacterium]
MGAVADLVPRSKAARHVAEVALHALAFAARVVGVQCSPVAVTRHRYKPAVGSDALADLSSKPSGPSTGWPSHDELSDVNSSEPATQAYNTWVPAAGTINNAPDDPSNW